MMMRSGVRVTADAFCCNRRDSWVIIGSVHDDKGGNRRSQSKDIRKMKALIAMSGGVDSSVAAKLMKDKGYECIGATMRLYDREDDELYEAGAELTDMPADGNTDESCSLRKACRTCCSEGDVADARAVAGKLDMLFHTLNYKAEFREKVIDKFTDSYERGITPNPCIDCNRYLKFDILLKKAGELGCDKVVTGHYARIEKSPAGGYLLKKALDSSKDQSYVLYMLTQEQLSHIEFPLGDMCKSDTRQIADKEAFINSDKPDSQDICFVPDGDYGTVICRYTGRDYPEGDFVDKDGKILGRHKGIIYYTLGQRKGLGISADRPLYVTGIDVKNNRVILGDNEDLFAKEAIFNDINWISGEAPEEGKSYHAKARYRQKEQPGHLKRIDDETYVFIFDEPQRAITPGQSLVVYDGDVVMGGGTIIRHE